MNLQEIIDNNIRFSVIEGCSNYYILDNGCVYSKITDKTLVPWAVTKGYIGIRLKGDDGKKHFMKIHRLVAKAFVPNPNNYPQVNHIDEDKNNNSAGNLEWCTNLYNSRYGTRPERIRKAHKGKSGKAVIMFDKDWNFIKEYPNEAAAQEDGYSQSDVSRVALGKSPMCKGMRFVFKEGYKNELYRHRENIAH